MKTLLRALATLVGLLCSEVHAGNLKVTLTPSQAVSAGAQWRVDGGSWRSSGTTVSNLSNTTHVVGFKAAPGWIAPTDLTVALSNGGTTSLTGTYVAPASLKINLTPSTGKWRVDSGSWQSSAATVSSLAPGNHAIDYQAISGYVSPASETTGLTSGQTTTLTRSYAQLASLKINLTPSTGKWRVDGGSWQNTGATVTTLAPGAHGVDYQAVSGHSAPAAESVSLPAGQTTTLARSYVQLAQLTVNLSPTSAQWRVDDGAWRNSGTTATGLTPGAHTLAYAPVSGFSSPPAESVNVAAGQSLTLARIYTALAKLNITLAPATGQWRIDGGAWITSGTLTSNLAPGAHAVDYQALSGYSAPPSESVSLVSGQTTNLSRAYVQLAQLTISLSPGAGQWRVNGGAWLASGAAVSLAPAQYTVEYAGVANYTAPASETLTLASAQNLTLNRAYAPLPAQLTVTLNQPLGGWRFVGSGPAYQASGTVLSNLAAGDYVIEYRTVTGYSAPATETVTLTPGQSLALARDYAALPNGQVSITLTPAHAEWSVNNGPWQASGATVTAPTGANTVSYASLSDYVTPPAETISVIGGEITSLVRTYVRVTQLTITLAPSNGQWSVDGGPGRDSGTTFTGIAVGSHTITYSSQPFHRAPPAEEVTIAAGDQVAFTRTYTPLTQISMNLTPAGGQWRLDGGAWRESGLSEDLTAGEHLIDYLPLDGYNTPPAETITLNAGQTHRLDRSYGLSGQLAISLDPGNALWRVDGGAWQASGTTLGNLSLGQHLVEYQDLPDYLAPAQESVTIAAGAITQLARTYTADPAFAIIHSFADAGTLPTALRGSDGRIYVVANTGASNGGGHLFRINADGSGYQRLKWFGSDPSDGYAPKALIEGSDGVLYGTTLYGNGSTTAISNGRVYRINKDGTGYAVLYVFGQANQGAPNSLLEGADGVLYGTTSSSGSGAGKVFKINRDGSGFTLLLNLTTSYGSTPQGLVQAPSGVIYGTARLGGPNASGCIFKFNPDGTGYAMVKGFAGGIDGADPRATLLVGSDQMLYGTTYAGGAAGRGLVYRLNPDGSGYQILRSFAAAPDGVGSEYALVENAAGALYGTTLGGGATNRGTLFRINKDGTGYSVVWSFSGTVADGGQPKMKLLPLDGGTFAGATTIGGTATKGLLFTIKDDGSNFSALKQLGLPGGGYPWSPVISGGNGVLYGTTSLGGSTGSGTIFRINEDGTGHAILQNLPGPNGGLPVGTLLRASDGALYGTTFSPSILFRVNTDGSGFTTLRNFVAGAPATNTWSGVIEGSDGALYGVMLESVYRVAKDGSGLTTLHAFAGGTADGTTAQGGLVQGADGRLYGTTYGGGSANAGVIFALNKDGTGYTILRHFLGGAADGSMPSAEMIQGSDGALYGSTYGGGPGNFGTLFKINPNGTGYTVLRLFTGAANDGALPSLAGLLEKGGFLYGATSAGGSFNKGTVYRLHLDGTGFEILVNFGLTPDDAIAPYSGLIEGSNGRLFGTTPYGADAGTIFRLRVE